MRPDSQFYLTNPVEIFDQQELFQIVTNEEIVEFSQAGTGEGFASAAVVERLTGVVERRICRPGIDAVDLAIAVATRLQSREKIDWQACSAIALSHTHPDEASSERLVQELARALNVPTSKFIVINYGCVGFLELMRLAVEHLEETGAEGPIPLLTVETPDAWHDASDRSFCGIVSTGATGALISRTRGHRIKDLHVAPRSTPSGSSDEILFWTESGRFLNFYGQPEERTVMRMNAMQVFMHGTNLMVEACQAAWRQVEHLNTRTIVASHQPSGKMLKAMISSLEQELSEVEFLNHLSHHANSISSTIPTVLSHLEQILEQHQLAPIVAGDHVLLSAAGICMAHRASHLAQGWAVLEW